MALDLEYLRQYKSQQSQPSGGPTLDLEYLRKKREEEEPSSAPILVERELTELERPVSTSAKEETAVDLPTSSVETRVVREESAFARAASSVETLVEREEDAVSSVPILVERELIELERPVSPSARKSPLLRD